MGGTNPAVVDGLRMHMNGSEVHVHDDINHRKFTAPAAGFKSDLKEVLQGGDGALAVSGTAGNELYLVKKSGRMQAFIGDPKKDITSDLESFMRKL